MLDVMQNQLLSYAGYALTGIAVKADFAAYRVRGWQVHMCDTCQMAINTKRDSGREDG